jgi:hypothetical protein
VTPSLAAALRLAALTALAAPIAACSWVTLTPGGEKVRVLERTEVSRCQRVGTTTATTRAAVVGVGRSYLKVQEELRYLARNAAADLGGDTVVAEGGIEDGRQTYGVYRCVGSAGRAPSASDSPYGPAVTRPLPP